MRGELQQPACKKNSAFSAALFSIWFGGERERLPSRLLGSCDAIVFAEGRFDRVLFAVGFDLRVVVVVVVVIVDVIGNERSRKYALERHKR